MPAKSSLNVSLTPEFTAFISTKLATGHYRSGSEVVRAALRLLAQQDDQRGHEKKSSGSSIGAVDDAPALPSFLQGGGETGALMRAYDWASSPLGDPSGWPSCLGTLLEVTLGSDQPMSIIWGPARTLLYNDRYADILMRKHPAALGQSFPEVWHEIWPEIGPLITRAFAGEAINVDDMQLVIHRKEAPDEAHFSFSYTPVRGDAGTILGVFCPCRETTANARAKATLTAENEHLGELFQQAPGFMCVLRGPEHVFEIINASYLQLVGHRRDIIGKPVRVALPEVEGQGFFELLDEVFSTGKPFRGFAMPVALQRQPGSPVEERFIDLVYQPITDDTATITGIFVEGYDVTERVHAEEQQKLLMREMSHRLKNLFAVASSMVALSARSAQTPQEMSIVVRGRLDALARANDLIRPGLIGADEEQHKGSTMDALVRTVLSPYVDNARLEDRECIFINGPPVPLGGDAVTTLALVFHETATNSAKYGALSAPTGRIHIAWTATETGLDLRWEEKDGPRIVEPPKAKGFGSELVKRSVTSQLHGTIEYDWQPHGLAVNIAVPLERLNR
jgi:putative addiction module CopG family antidote